MLATIVNLVREAVIEAYGHGLRDGLSSIGSTCGGCEAWCVRVPVLAVSLTAGLTLAGTEVGDPLHRQPGLIGTLHPVPSAASGKVPIEVGWLTVTSMVQDLLASVSGMACIFGAPLGRGRLMVWCHGC
ncbi:hypothetical protein ABZ502_17845 [Streptomyces abikoensis]|uniref:hypothetical protein n=1 Tax=Streptomyces abikoensis TaxID=97398 RepID=UPI0033EB82BC